MSRTRKPVCEKTAEEIENMTWKEYTKYYRQTHPQQTLKWRLNSYVRILRKHGYIVIEPQEHENQ